MLPIWTAGTLFHIQVAVDYLLSNNRWAKEKITGGVMLRMIVFTFEVRLS